MKRVNHRFAVIFTVLTALALIFTANLALAEDYSTIDLNEQLVMATLWMQTSAEYRAICYQTSTWRS